MALGLLVDLEETNDCEGFEVIATRRLHRAKAIKVERYTARAAEFLAYNPEAPRVAALVIEAIRKRRRLLNVDHIGSTAVPGCGGKGIIDLLVSYPAGAVCAARDALDRLGFQPQGGPEPFPESRPMRVGAVTHGGKVYLVHSHVICAGDREGQDLLKFRDRLRADADLVQAYQFEKLAIVARGITASREYSKAKGEFIRAVLADAC